MRIHEVEKLAEILSKANNVHIQNELYGLFMESEDLSDNENKQSKKDSSLKDYVQFLEELTDRLESIGDIPPVPFK